MDNELNKELEYLKQDKIKYKEELKHQQLKMEKLLRNSMGTDINNVLSGKTKIKLTFKEKMKYKIQNFLNFIFKTF